MNATSANKAVSGRLEGGARLNGGLLPDSKGTALVTIVTVVFNDEKNLQRTIDSIASQTYKNLEHIVIDGGSTDGTLDIIRNNPSINYWLSEKDGGIYDAMNKGVSLASGEWINFMNSGDVFVDSDIVEAVFGGADIQNSDLIYGDVEVDYGEFKKIRKAGPVGELKRGMQFSHQSLFAKRSILTDIGFDLSYRTAADYNFIVISWINKFRFCQIDLVVSSISSGGVSDVRRLSSHKQRAKILTSSLKLSRMDKVRLWGQELYILSADFLKSSLPGWLSGWIKKIK